MMDHNIAAKPQDSYDDREKWVHGSFMDNKGQVPLRATTGVWRAALFIVAIGFSERLIYFGIFTNLVVYLTRILHQDLKTAVRNVNYWSGVTTLMPLFGGFLADAYLGRYSTILVSTINYIVGLSVLTMSWFIPALKACDSNMCRAPRKAHEVAFFVAIYLMSIATGGHRPSLESFGADQFDDDHDEERRKKWSYFNWWNFGICAGILTGVTVVVYLEDHVGWGAACILFTSVMALSLVILIIGRPFYRYQAPTGSPLTPILQVFVAAIAKRDLPYPSDSSQLHEVSKAEYTKGRVLCHTENLKLLDKAAIIEYKDNGVGTISLEAQNPWKLATVTKVEEAKLIINMIPIWLSMLAFGICASQPSTFFIKQAIVMDRHINNFSVPPASMFSLAAVTLIISIALYEKLIVPISRKVLGNERGIKILQRIGIGMLFCLLTMIIAALVEKKRLDSLKHNPAEIISAFWLAPQFIVIGIGDTFTFVGLQEYFYDQVPDSMRSLGIAFYLSVMGAASFANNLLITIADHASENISGKSWFGKDLNSSRLDLYYWLLAAIVAANLCVYVIISKRYSYKNVNRS